MIPTQFFELPNSFGKLVIYHNMCTDSQIPNQTPLSFFFFKLPHLVKTDSEKKYFDGDNA